MRLITGLRFDFLTFPTLCSFVLGKDKDKKDQDN